MIKSLLCLLCMVCVSFVSSGQTDSNFIEFLDGKKMELGTEEIRDVSGMFGGSSLKVGKTKYAAKLIKGYQSNGKYYIQKNGGFCYRLIHGKISGYQEVINSTDSKGRPKQFTMFYLQKGEEGEWVDYTKKNFFKMISDHPEALKMAEAHKGELIFSRNVMEILAVYNKE